MHKLVAAAAIAAAGFAVVAAPGANAAPSPKPNQSVCFTGGGGTCTALGGGAFTLGIPASGNYSSYAGVTVSSKSLTGTAFADLTKVQFTYEGDIAGGSPRYSLKVVGADGRDGWVFVDAASCDDNGDGVVDPLDEPACVVSGYFFNTDGSTESFYYTSWDAFLAEESGAVLGDRKPFVVYDFAPGGTAPEYADNPEGSVTVSEIFLAAAKKR